MPIDWLDDVRLREQAARIDRLAADLDLVNRLTKKVLETALEEGDQLRSLHNVLNIGAAEGESTAIRLRVDSIVRCELPGGVSAGWGVVDVGTRSVAPSGTPPWG